MVRTDCCRVPAFLPCLLPHWYHLLPGRVRPRGLRAEARHLVFKAHLVLGSLSDRTQHLRSLVTLTLRPQAQAAGDEALQLGPRPRTRELRKCWPRPGLCEEKNPRMTGAGLSVDPPGRGQGRLRKAPQRTSHSAGTTAQPSSYVPGVRIMGTDPSVPSWPFSDSVCL